MNEMRVEYTPIDDVAEAVRNPKLHDFETLAASIRRFGFAAPIAVDERTGRLVAGHGRLETLRRMFDAGESMPDRIKEQDGEWLVPVIRGLEFADETEAEAFLVADNRISALGGWDTEGLQDILISQADLEGIGFEVADLAAIEKEIAATSFLVDAPPPPDATEDDGPATPPPTSDSVLGDVWHLGDHILVCGSATDGACWPALEGVVGGFTSPPYNAGSNALGGNSAMTDAKYIGTSDNMTDEQYAALLRESTTQLLSVCRNVVVNIQMLAGNKVPVTEWIAEFAAHLVDRGIWFKGNGPPQMAANCLNSSFEDLLVFSPNVNPSKAIECSSFQGTISNVHEGKSASGENIRPDLHAATMPMHLANFCVGKLLSKADWVIDPFGGTGTTMICCEQLGKRCLTIELEPVYCDVVVERWEKFTGKTAVKQ